MIDKSKIDILPLELMENSSTIVDVNSPSRYCSKRNVCSSFLVQQDKKERTITTITLFVALAIGGSEILNQIEKFSKEAAENEYTNFIHYNFFYSYPEFGKKWLNGKDCEFHRVNTKCHLCDYTPERNYAGVGTIYLLNNGICNKDILVHKGFKKSRGRLIHINEYEPNTPRLSQMILLCQKHIGIYFEWCKNKEVKKLKKLQLELF